MKTIKKIIPLLLCICIAMLCACNSDNTETNKKIAYGYEFQTEIDYGITVEDIHLYSGEYVEDASFGICENVAALKVKNNSGSDIQLLRINVKTNIKELTFEITTLNTGSAVVALEKSKQTLDEDEKILSIEITKRSDFKSSITLKEDVFTV